MKVEGNVIKSWCGLGSVANESASLSSGFLNCNYCKNMECIKWKMAVKEFYEKKYSLWTLLVDVITGEGH